MSTASIEHNIAMEELRAENEQLRAENEQLRAENEQLRGKVATLTGRFSALLAMFAALLDELLDMTSTYFDEKCWFYTFDLIYDKADQYSPERRDRDLCIIKEKYNVSKICEGIDFAAV